MTEVQQLLIAAEALVIFTRRQMENIDKEYNREAKLHSIKFYGESRDAFKDIYDKYYELYDGLYMTIEELKEHYNEIGVDVFVNRFLNKILNILGDKIHLCERRISFYQTLVVEPHIKDNKNFLESYKDFIYTDFKGNHH
jgi:hypothetical protein